MKEKSLYKNPLIIIMCLLLIVNTVLLIFLFSARDVDKSSSVNSIMDISSASQYLGISEEEMLYIVKNIDTCPYMRRDVDDYIFSKEGIDNWLASGKHVSVFLKRN